MSRTVLVTGGAGYIGSHTVLQLLNAGHAVVVVDNFANSSPVALERVRELATSGDLSVHKVDLLDGAALDAVFVQHDVGSVVHFAGLKAVGESVLEPARYHEVNVGGAMSLFGAMRRHGVRHLLFSSTCALYGNPAELPIRESTPPAPESPYAGTKLYVETMLREIAAAEDGWRVLRLRYFNPVGAHASGRIGEDPVGPPANLVPLVMQVAIGAREHVEVFGDDYPTRDGTGVRDYIHVEDLAAGHLAALAALDTVGADCPAVNLGTGAGHTVLEVIQAAQEATGRKIPYVIAPRRPGDVAAAWADPGLALQLLGWRAETTTMEQMCADAWRWQVANPRGYSG